MPICGSCQGRGARMSMAREVIDPSVQLGGSIQEVRCEPCEGNGFLDKCPDCTDGWAGTGWCKTCDGKGLIPVA